VIRFVKMHGLGNDFVLLDGVRGNLKGLPFEELSRAMCDRRLGVGADGLLLAEGAQGGRFRMRMWNPDGSESEMCGNGIRCFAKYLLDAGHAGGPSMQVETGAGLLEPSVLPDGSVRVDMWPPKLKRGEIGLYGDAESTFVEQSFEFLGLEMKGTSVSMGNPHVAIFVPDVSAVPLEEWGPAVENHDLFPNRINAHFVQVRSPKHLVQRTWERGAGATLACGTGACAVAVAGRVTGRSGEDVTVSLPGGDLRIECREGENVFMTGPAVSVFAGEWPV
jgi:diaminopimelate epimerase